MYNQPNSATSTSNRRFSTFLSSFVDYFLLVSIKLWKMVLKFHYQFSFQPLNNIGSNFHRNSISALDFLLRECGVFIGQIGYTNSTVILNHFCNCAIINLLVEVCFKSYVAIYYFKWLTALVIGFIYFVFSQHN